MNHLLYCLFVCLLATPHLYAQTVPAHRLVDWTKAGVRLDTTTAFPIVDATMIGLVGDGVTPNDSMLGVFLNTYLGQGLILEFPAGQYRFEQTIGLQSNTLLRGQGADSTTLLFDLGGNGHAISVQGSRSSDSTLLKHSAPKGATYLRLWNTHVLEVGDWVQLQQYDLDWVFSTWGQYHTGQFVQIERLSGDTAWVHQPLRMAYDTARSAALWVVNMKQNVGIECLKIHRLDDTAPAQGSNIHLKYVTNSWVSGIESENCTFAHVEAEFSAHLTIAHSYFHHGFTYGGSGRAYGVVFQLATSDARAENNIFEHLRHSVLFQAGANGNVVAYNYSHDPYWDNTPNDAAGDIVLHGNYVYSNLFEQNICQTIVVDDSHGSNGADNFFFRNRTQLYGLYNHANSPNQIFVANEATNTGFPYRLANYNIQGTGHLIHGNNDKGSITPAGTQAVPEISYAYAQRPSFVPAVQWGNLGTPNPYNTGSIPAYDRWQTGNLFHGACDNQLLTTVVGAASNTAAVQVYPNPTQQTVHLNAPTVVQRVVLYHPNGACVKVWAPQQAEVTLSLPILPTGMYVLRIYRADASPSTKRLFIY